MSAQSDDLIALLIRQLKDDSEKRIVAASRLTAVAKMVGPVKTRTSILPKLGTEIFAEGMDPDDQVAKVVSEQLGEFVELVGGPVQVNESLLKPLTVCASVEETVVRDAASTSLSTIARTLDDTTDFCRIVIEELTKTDNWFTSKVSACAIFEAAYPNANSDTKANLLATFAALAKDSTPMVRRSAAKHIGGFARSVAANAKADLEQHILPLFSSLCNDKTDSVKIAAIDESMVEIALLMEVSESKERILPLVLASAEDDSWRQRNAIAKNISRLIPYFLKSPDAAEELDVCFKTLLQDSESEVRTHALQSVPKLHKVVDKATFKKLDVVAALQQSVDDPINQGMAAKACRVALADACIDIIDADLKEQVLPIIVKLLRDEDIEVVLKVFEALSTLPGVELNDPKLQTEDLLQSWLNSDEYPWRLREKMADLMPRIAKDYGAVVFESRMMGLYAKLFQDRMSTVRLACSGAVSGLRDELGSDWVLQNLVPRLVDWINGTVKGAAQPALYLQRVAVVRAVESIFTKKESAALETACIDLLKIGLSDSVENVQIIACQVAAAAKPNVGQDAFGQIKGALEVLQGSQANDVRDAATHALNL